jgi:hypothetical protein
VDSLLKLETSKAFDKKTSVLQYLVVAIKRSEGAIENSLLDFAEDLDSVNDAARISLSVLGSDVGELDTGVRQSKKLAGTLEKRGSADEVAIVNTFVETARVDVTGVRKSLDQARSLFESVLNYFGEDPNLSPEDFFSSLVSFGRAFETARECVEREAKKRKTEELKRVKALEAAEAKRFKKEKQEAEAKRREEEAARRESNREQSEGLASGGEVAIQWVAQVAPPAQAAEERLLDRAAKLRAALGDQEDDSGRESEWRDSSS